ncbi:unnamed protein product [Triticum turgidum subsp. durum]|uniref:Uncharacterized protein n=1 Tax=Triticum turgidum subsp. durum TaxID=4567 RepID=A0A9R1QFR4_TRITD|nr:unnamed protein product [Triticum turgidum subsp. durum]
MPSPPPQIASPPRETMSREASGASVSSAPVPEPERQQGQGNQGEEAGWTPLEKVSDKVEELYSLRDTFFPRDPSEKSASLRACADAALGVLDSLPPVWVSTASVDMWCRGLGAIKRGGWPLA